MLSGLFKWIAGFQVKTQYEAVHLARYRLSSRQVILMNIPPTKLPFRVTLDPRSDFKHIRWKK